jgi:hypothetical protein
MGGEVRFFSKIIRIFAADVRKTSKIIKLLGLDERVCVRARAGDWAGGRVHFSPKAVRFLGRERRFFKKMAKRGIGKVLVLPKMAKIWEKWELNSGTARGVSGV